LEGTLLATAIITFLISILNINAKLKPGLIFLQNKIAIMIYAFIVAPLIAMIYIVAIILQIFKKNKNDY